MFPTPEHDQAPTALRRACGDGQKIRHAPRPHRPPSSVSSFRPVHDQGSVTASQSRPRARSPSLPSGSALSSHDISFAHRRLDCDPVRYAQRRLRIRRPPYPRANRALACASSVLAVSASTPPSDAGRTTCSGKPQRTVPPDDRAGARALASCSALGPTTPPSSSSQLCFLHNICLLLATAV